MKIKYDMVLMKSMDFFASITGAKLEDCFLDQLDMLTFVVKQNDMGKAIGKDGQKVKMLERALNRNIKIVEFNPQPLLFIQNLIYDIEFNTYVNHLLNYR